MDLAVGQKLRDNDPRMEGRVIEIASLDEHSVVCKSGSRYVRVKRSRIHNDGKTRRTGFDLITDAAMDAAAAPAPARS